MRIAPVADIKARFAYLKASEEGPIIVTRHGRPVAVLLSIDDDEEIERLLLAYSPKVQEILGGQNADPPGAGDLARGILARGRGRRSSRSSLMNGVRR